MKRAAAPKRAPKAKVAPTPRRTGGGENPDAGAETPGSVNPKAKPAPKRRGKN